MRLLALASIAASLCVVTLVAQSSDARLDRAVERIERNDLNGLRRLLTEDPSLVRRTGAGVLPQWQWTLLHKATAEQASLELVRALIDAGADINARDNEGNTPLHFSVKRINREKFATRDYEGIVRLLLEKKADVHIVNVGGATPLHTAAAFRADPSAVEMLIQAGADVNLKAPRATADGRRCDAAARNSGGIVAVLLVRRRSGSKDAIAHGAPGRGTGWVRRRSSRPACQCPSALRWTWEWGRPEHRSRRLKRIAVVTFLCGWFSLTPPDPGTPLGRISFPTSGSPAAQPQFIRGVLLLHSFEYDDAIDAFREAERLDPGFAMAYWGEAMCFNQPLWEHEELDKARAALARLGPSAAARAKKAPTPRERGYLDAVERLFGDGDKATRDRAYADRMAALVREFPGDDEAAAFYALALPGTIRLRTGTRPWRSGPADRVGHPENRPSGRGALRAPRV